MSNVWKVLIVVVLALAVAVVLFVKQAGKTAPQATRPAPAARDSSDGRDSSGRLGLGAGRSAGYDLGAGQPGG